MNTTLKVNEAAQAIGVSASQVIAWGYAGAFRMYDVSGKPSAARRSYRIDKASWAAFLESRVVKAPTLVSRPRKMVHLVEYV